MKSTEVVILAPICCAAAMIGHTEVALRQVYIARGKREETLQEMCSHLRNALAELDSMRKLYDQHLA